MKKVTKFGVLAILAIFATSFMMIGCDGGGDTAEAAALKDKKDPAADAAAPGGEGQKGGMAPPGISGP
jgi:hypothetical protein